MWPNCIRNLYYLCCFSWYSASLLMSPYLLRLRLCYLERTFLDKSIDFFDNSLVINCEGETVAHTLTHFRWYSNYTYCHRWFYACEAPLGRVSPCGLHYQHSQSLITNCHKSNVISVQLDSGCIRLYAYGRSCDDPLRGGTGCQLLARWLWSIAILETYVEFRTTLFVRC